jgi:hypothetical protein
MRAFGRDDVDKFELRAHDALNVAPPLAGFN